MWTRAGPRTRTRPGLHLKTLVSTPTSTPTGEGGDVRVRGDEEEQGCVFVLRPIV